MFGKLCKNSSVNNILIITLSNIGDVVLTCPVIDILLKDFPRARFTVIVGEKAKTLFASHPRIEVKVFHKKMPLFYYVLWFLNLRLRSFDLIVDLRETALGIFLPCRFRTPVVKREFKGHMRFKHLQRLKAIYPDAEIIKERLSIILKKVSSVSRLSKYVVLAPGAADQAKRWMPSGFAAVADHLVNQGFQIIFVGDRNDAQTIDGILAHMKSPGISMAGKTDLQELAFIISRAHLTVFSFD